MGITKTLTLLLLVLITANGCTFFEAPQSTTSTDDFQIDEQFKSEVALVCMTFEESTTQALATNFSLSDTELFNDTLSKAEEDFDKIIAALTDIDVDENIEEDWEILVDDFTAIRDSFPELLNVLNQLARLDQQHREDLDPDRFEEQQEEIDTLQKEYEMLTRGNNQRLRAIDDFFESYEIDECRLSSF